MRYNNHLGDLPSIYKIKLQAVRDTELVLYDIERTRVLFTNRENKVAVDPPFPKYGNPNPKDNVVARFEYCKYRRKVGHSMVKCFAVKKKLEKVKKNRGKNTLHNTSSYSNDDYYSY